MEEVKLAIINNTEVIEESAALQRFRSCVWNATEQAPQFLFTLADDQLLRIVPSGSDSFSVLIDIFEDTKLLGTVPVPRRTTARIENVQAEQIEAAIRAFFSGDSERLKHWIDLNSVLRSPD
jgi:hypothetical protein